MINAQLTCNIFSSYYWSTIRLIWTEHQLPETFWDYIWKCLAPKDHELAPDLLKCKMNHILLIQIMAAHRMRFIYFILTNRNQNIKSCFLWYCLLTKSFVSLISWPYFFHLQVLWYCIMRLVNCKRCPCEKFYRQKSF